MTEEDKEVHRMFMQKLDEDCSVDLSENIEHPPTAISMGSYSISTKAGIKRYPIPIGTYGNFSYISGQPKTKKSFLVSLLASVYLSKDGQNRYGANIRADRGDKCVVHFDTEQGKFHAQRVFRRPYEMNGDVDLGCYHTYSLRAIGYKTRIDFIEYKLQQLSDDGMDVGLVIIDGIADLVSDVNNIEESNLIVQKIMTWSSVYNCHIVLVVHLNHNSEKSTGHLGSFMTKKCETELLLTQNEGESEIISVKCKRSRNFSFKTFNFTVDDLGYPKVLDDVDDIVPNEPQEKSRWQKQLKY
jgi:hypothetical protein